MPGFTQTVSFVVSLGIGLTACAGVEHAHAQSERDHPYRDSLTRMSRSEFTAETAELLRSTLPEYPDAWSYSTVRDTGDSAGSNLPEQATAYLEHYGIASEAAEWNIGSVTVSGTAAPDGFRIAAQTFVPEDPRPDAPAVLVLHGYFDHTATNRYAIEELLVRGYRVVAFDLPGHGLSSGRRGRIEDFGDYGRAVHATVDAIRAGRIAGLEPDTRLAAMTHSTGSSAVIEYLETGGDALERLVFVAPLVRIIAFPVARVGLELSHEVVDYFPRLMSGGSSNDAFIEFARRYDPLAVDKTSLKWADSYFDWEESRRTIEQHELPLLLVQAGRDRVVDSDFNTKFLRDFFPDTRLIELEKARHNVFNEPVHLRPGLYTRIHRFLSDS
ncbi:MAG: alpha/beta hydrolase [Spirochaetales bacterium]